MRPLNVIFFLGILTFLSTACGAASTPVPPTATETPLPPTSTPTPRPTAAPTEAFVIASTAEELLGTWGNPAVAFHRFNSDGTLYYAHSVEALERPFAINSFWMKGNKLHIQELSVDGVAPCGKGGISIYEVKLMASGAMKLRAIEEKCSLRRGSTEGSYDPIP